MDARIIFSTSAIFHSLAFRYRVNLYLGVNSVIKVRCLNMYYKIICCDFSAIKRNVCSSFGRLKSIEENNKEISVSCNLNHDFFISYTVLILHFILYASVTQ